MKKTAGSMVRAAREKAELTRAQLAKRLSLSPAYLGHIENDSHVRLSERVVERLQVVLKLRIPAKLVEKHNAHATRWNKAYNKTRKAA